MSREFPFTAGGQVPLPPDISAPRGTSVQVMREVEDALADLQKSLIEGKVTQSEYNKEVKKVIDRLKGLEDSWESLMSKGPRGLDGMVYDIKKRMGSALTTWVTNSSKAGGGLGAFATALKGMPTAINLAIAAVQAHAAVQDLYLNQQKKSIALVAASGDMGTKSVGAFSKAAFDAERKWLISVDRMAEMWMPVMMSRNREVMASIDAGGGPSKLLDTIEEKLVPRTGVAPEAFFQVFADEAMRGVKGVDIQKSLFGPMEGEDRGTTGVFARLNAVSVNTSTSFLKLLGAVNGATAELRPLGYDIATVEGKMRPFAEALGKGIISAQQATSLAGGWAMRARTPELLKTGLMAMAGGGPGITKGMMAGNPFAVATRFEKAMEKYPLDVFRQVSRFSEKMVGKEGASRFAAEQVGLMEGLNRAQVEEVTKLMAEPGITNEKVAEKMEEIKTMGSPFEAGWKTSQMTTLDAIQKNTAGLASEMAQRGFGMKGAYETPVEAANKGKWGDVAKGLFVDFQKMTPGGSILLGGNQFEAMVEVADLLRMLVGLTDKGNVDRKQLAAPGTAKPVGSHRGK